MKKLVMALVVLAGVATQGTHWAEAQQADVKLKEVVVTATKTEKDPKDVTQSVTVITADEIKRAGVTTVTEVIERAVGVAITNYGPTGALNTIRIRGADYSRVLVLLDGVRLNSPRDLGFDMSAMPVSVDMVERIEIVRGPASALYGSEAVGGVVNIITKKPLKNEAIIAGAIGTHGYDSATLGFGNNTGSTYYHLEGTRTTYDGFRPNSDLDQWTYGGKIGVNLSERVNLEVTGNYTNKENGVPGPKNTVGVTDRQWDRIFVTGAGISMRTGGGHSFKVRASKTDETLQFKSAYGFSVHESSVDTTEAQADLLLGSWNVLTLGYEARRDHLDSTDTGKHVSDLKAFFLQDEMSLGQSFIIVAGVRRDDQSQYGEQTSPKLSGRYLNKNTGTILRASYGEGFRSPTPNDLYSPVFYCPSCAQDPATGSYTFDLVTAGNPNLKPETSKEYEIGIEQPWGKNERLRLTGFSRDVHNMIVWLKSYPTTSVEQWQPENIGNATVRGYEAELTLALASSARLAVNYTYTNPVDESTGNKIPFIPKTQWKGSLSIDVDKHTNLYFEGRAVENYVNLGEPAWKYSVMDAKVVERMEGSSKYSSEFFIALTNVFDRKYEVAQNYPMPPKEVRGGVTVRF